MGLWDHVEKAEPSLAVCGWDECEERGNYRRCYLNDLFIICPRYLAHQNYLKTVRRMKNERLRGEER